MRMMASKTANLSQSLGAAVLRGYMAWLVALVVVSVGTFGVMKLNTVLLSGTGLSKTRAEAQDSTRAQ